LVKETYTIGSGVQTYTILNLYLSSICTDATYELFTASITLINSTTTSSNALPTNIITINPANNSLTLNTSSFYDA